MAKKSRSVRKKAASGRPSLTRAKKLELKIKLNRWFVCRIEGKAFSGSAFGGFCAKLPFGGICKSLGGKYRRKKGGVKR